MTITDDMVERAFDGWHRSVARGSMSGIRVHIRAALTAALEGSVAVPVEVREKDGAIDEIVIKRGNVHIEQMDSSRWFMGVDASDGSYWQFWFGALKGKAHVGFRHTVHSTAEAEQARRDAVTRQDRGGESNG